MPKQSKMIQKSLQKYCCSCFVFSIYSWTCACPELCLTYPVRLHWKNLIFLLQASFNFYICHLGI